MSDQVDAPERTYVVILYGGAQSGWCELNRCPMSVEGLFTRGEAGAYADRVPAGLQPHIFEVRRPSS